MMNKTVLVFTFVSAFAFGLSDVIQFDLFKYKPNDSNTHILQQFHNFSSDRSEIKIKNIGDDIGFVLVQVHSFLKNVTLYLNSTSGSHWKVTGTNIGLIYADDNATVSFFVSQNYTKSINILVVLTVYQDTDPVPGGCNLIFNNKVAPYQMVSHTDDVIIVNFQAPSGYGVDCDNNSVKVDKYHLFLPEYDNTEETYFNSIQKMLTVENIVKNGYKVRNDGSYYKYKTLYSAYRGTGELFAVVATLGGRSSAYVPTISYACDVNSWDETCTGPLTTHWKYISAIFLILGLFVCFFGHYFFMTTVTIVAYTFGVLVTYVILAVTSDFSFEEVSTTSLALGLVYAVGWLFIWRKFGIPIVSTLLSYFLTGFLTASIIFYCIADIDVFRSNANYWLTFVGIMAATLIILLSMCSIAHRFACTVLGSYAVISAMNYYFGGYFQYIVINTIRRITVKNFYMAIIDPPYQIKDVLMTIIWTFLIMLSVYSQSRRQRGRPPFPPPRNDNDMNVPEWLATEREFNETSPLLQNRSDYVY